MKRADTQSAPKLNRPSSLEEVYTSCTPLLLSAIAKLSGQGYHVDPATALDLVHDFYLEALPGLFERFDDSRGRFSTYLYGAFLHFARPRIVRNMRWEGMLGDLETHRLRSQPDEAPEFSDATTEAMAAAFAALPRPLQAVLKARVVGGLSERDTARQLKLSRYFVRLRTAEALGRLAVAIGRDERIPADVRPLALRLWRDEDTLMQAASNLGLSRQEIRSRYQELLNRLSAALDEPDANAGE